MLPVWSISRGLWLKGPAALERVPAPALWTVASSGPRRLTCVEETFELSSEYIPLCDLIKYIGIAETGGLAKHLIAEGMVSVDGEVELRRTRKIRRGQTVSGEGFTIAVK